MSVQRGGVKGPGWTLVAAAVIALVASVAVIGAFAFHFPLSGQSVNYLNPGPEGVDAGVQGFQAGTGQVANASSLSPMLSYEWVNNDPKNAVVQRVDTGSGSCGSTLVYGYGCLYSTDSGSVLAEVQRPAVPSSSTPFALPSNNTIAYDKLTQVSSDQLELDRYVATLVPVTFTLQLSSVPGGGYYTFKGDSLWFYLNTVKWMDAFAAGSVPQDTAGGLNSSYVLSSSQYAGAFPLIAWVGAYQGGQTYTKSDGSTCSPSSGCYPPSGISQFIQVTPSLQGRFVSLYSSPSSVYTNYFASCAGQAYCSGVSSSQVLDQALQPGTLPDPRLSQTEFFKVSLDSFGPYVSCTGILGACSSHDDYYPAVYYQITVLYAFYGHFTYLWTTQAASQVGYNYSGPNATWQVRQTQVVQTVDPLTAAWNGFSAWAAKTLGLPSAIAGWFLLAVGLIFVAAVVFVVFIVIAKRLGVSRKDIDSYARSSRKSRK